ncbi:hypothetical protein Tco_1384348 [Tanacetum coccineum]
MGSRSIALSQIGHEHITEFLYLLQRNVETGMVIDYGILIFKACARQLYFIGINTLPILVSSKIFGRHSLRYSLRGQRATENITVLSDSIHICPRRHALFCEMNRTIIIQCPVELYVLDTTLGEFDGWSRNISSARLLLDLS